MWIFLYDSFFSVVQNDNNSEQLLVRARFEGDIQRVFGENLEVYETPDSDYRFRAVVLRDDFKAVMNQEIDNINYRNFKNTIPNTMHEKKSAFSQVWSVLYNAQCKFYGQPNWWLNYRDYK